MTQVMAGFRDLRVWQSAMSLVEQVYLTTRTFPRHETCGLASQMQRAGVSVPSNIAEGHMPAHLAEYLQHIAIAQGSLAELETQIEIGNRLGYVSPGRSAELLAQSAAFGRQLYALRNSLSKRKPDTRHLGPDTP
jgi:four helix bundle protein